MRTPSTSIGVAPAAGGSCARAAPHRRGYETLGSEGLGDVVVAPAQADDLVKLIVARGQHRDWYRASRNDADLRPSAWAADGEDHEIDRVLLEPLQRLLAVARLRHGSPSAQGEGFWIDSSSSASRIVALSGMKQRIGTSRTR
jgi:hypothetical protein